MPSLITTGAAGMSSLTWSQAATRLSRLVSLGDPDVIAAAKDAISETLQDWISRRNWRYLEETHSIPVVGGTSTYALPSGFKRPYSCTRLSDNGFLNYIEAQKLDVFRSGSTTIDHLAYYTLYGNQEIDFFYVEEDDTVQLRYYRLGATTGNDNDFLDIPARFENYILHGARSHLLLEKGSEEFQAWARKYAEGYILARKDDEEMPSHFVEINVPPTAPFTPPYLREEYY